MKSATSHRPITGALLLGGFLSAVALQLHWCGTVAAPAPDPLPLRENFRGSFAKPPLPVSETTPPADPDDVGPCARASD